MSLYLKFIELYLKNVKAKIENNPPLEICKDFKWIEISW